MIILGFTACESNTPEESQSTAIPSGVYNLRPDILPVMIGNWTLNTEQTTLTDQGSVLVMSVEYTHPESDVPALISMFVYQTPSTAQTDFNQQYDLWQSEPSNIIEPIPAFADAAYILNEQEATIVWDGDSYLIVDGQDGNHNTLELLMLTQIGLDTLRNREVPPNHTTFRGSLGQATLEPIENTSE